MTTNDEYGKATHDLEQAEKLQEMMKKANAIIRSKKNVTERLMSEAGLSESNAMQIQQKDFAGRVGFPTYKLTNNNANISRLKERVNMLNDKLESAEKGNETYTFSEVGGGGTIEINYDIDRVQLLFPNGRVDNELYKKLRSNGYVYSPTNKAFQRKITPQAISNAIYLTKATKGEVAQQKADSLVNLTDADRQQMLESKKFSYVSGNIYNALPPSFKEYTGAETFVLVYFSTVKENVKEGVKRYFKENMPIVDLEKITINVYPQTYVREAKKLYEQQQYLPSNTEPNVLVRLKNQLDSYQKMSDRVDEENIETEGINDSDEPLKDLQKYSSPKKYNSEIEVGKRYYDNRYQDYYTIEKMTEVYSGGDVTAILKYDKGATRKESGDFILYHIDSKQHSLSKESPKEEIYSSFNDATIDQIIENIQDEVYANWQGYEPREREVKNSIWREVNKMNLRQENKTNLLDAVYQKMYNKKEKINEISYLYDEKTKELPEMNNNIEEIERLKKEIANGERLMANPRFSGDVTNEINRWKKQLAELEGKENSNTGKIPAKFITLQIRDDRSQQQKYSDYDYDGANDKMRWLLDNKKFSDLNYNIEFEDGETLSGVIDCEPREFFKGVANPFTRHLNTFWGNVAKGKGAFMGAEEAQQAKELVEKYDLGEVKASESKIGKAELVIEETTKDEIGDVTELTDAELKKYLDMLTLKDVRRAIQNAEGVKIAIENEIKKRSTNNLAKDIEETTYSQFKGVHHSYKNQYVLNKAIEELLMTKDGDYSSEEKLFIRKYSGYGGLEKYGKGGKGAFFEFYTPTEIIERMWGLAYKYGYNNGSVLETSVGTGEFFRYAPKDAKLVGYEISEYSGKICKILYPTAEINIQPFEKTFIKNNFTVKGRLDDLEKFSLVIGNPPYGDFSTVESRYMSGMGEKDYTEARNYVEYFIRRGMDLLESGGLLVFIIGASLKNGGTMFLDSDMSPVKKWLSENCTLETAYRLPDSVFERTGVTADIIVLKKN